MSLLCIKIRILIACAQQVPTICFIADVRLFVLICIFFSSLFVDATDKCLFIKMLPYDGAWNLYFSWWLRSSYYTHCRYIDFAIVFNWFRKFLFTFASNLIKPFEAISSWHLLSFSAVFIAYSYETPIANQWYAVLCCALRCCAYLIDSSSWVLNYFTSHLSFLFGCGYQIDGIFA